MKQKQIIFRENSYQKRIQFQNERIALVMCALVLIFTLIFIGYVNQNNAVTNDLFTYSYFIISIVVVEVMFLQFRSLKVFPYLIATEAVTKENMYGFVIKFNGFANIINILELLVNFGLLWFNYHFNVECERTLAWKQKETEALVMGIVRVYREANYLFLILCIGICILVVTVSALLSYLKQGGDEIFRVTLSREGQTGEYTIDREGITLVSTKGATKTLDLEQERLEFSNGHVIVTGKFGSTVYDKGSIEKIVVQGNKIDMEVKYDTIQKRWCLSEGGNMSINNTLYIV